MKFLGPMRWIGTITPPAWNHDDFTILAAMSKRRTRSAWPHVSPRLDVQVFLMFYRGSMEETQFKAVMSSPDQAEWICHDLITSQENKRSFQVGNPPSSLLKWNPPPTALFQIAERFLFTKSFPSIGRVPSSPEPLIGDWEAHCEKRGSQKTSRCLSQKDVWVSKNIAIEVNSTLWWSQAVPYKMTRKLKTGYRSSSSPVNFTKSVNFLMFGNFKMRSGIWRIVELECFQHMSSSGGSSS